MGRSYTYEWEITAAVMVVYIVNSGKLYAVIFVELKDGIGHSTVGTLSKTQQSGNRMNQLHDGKRRPRSLESPTPGPKVIARFDRPPIRWRKETSAKK